MGLVGAGGTGAGSPPAPPGLACFQAVFAAGPSGSPWALRTQATRRAAGHGLTDGQHGASAAAHRRACGALSMTRVPSMDSAAFLPAAISTLTASTETAIQTCPPLDRWRMKLYIGGVVVALLLFLGAALAKAAVRLWVLFATRMWGVDDDGGGPTDARTEPRAKARAQREEGAQSLYDELRNPSIFQRQTAVRAAAPLRKEVGSARQAAALMERPPMQSVGPAAEAWERVKGREGDQEYMMLRHRKLGVSIELSVTGKGVLFRSSDGMVWRCWADGTFNERFSFRTGDKLMQSPKADVLSSVLGVPGGRKKDGHWAVEWQRAGGLVSIVDTDGEESLYLRADGFAFFGGGNRGVLVSADQTEPQVVQEDQLREMYGLARVSTETKVRIKEVCSALRVLAG
jgi:hypothetical protein